MARTFPRRWQRLFTCVMWVCAAALAACGGGGGGGGSDDSGTPPVGQAAPAAPADVIAVARDRGANLSWEAIAGAATYTVQRATATTANGGVYQTVASALATPAYADAGLTIGTAYFYQVTAHNAAGASAASNEALATPVAPVGGVLWPLSRQSSADADSIRHPYAVRRFENYDFHAGIDIHAPAGTPIYPVMDGVVSSVQSNTSTIGAGNNVVVNHGQQRTAYLHMSTITVALGQTVTAGVTPLGAVGATGARSNHLHFTYMVGRSSEAQSKNPMEILPHTPPGPLSAVFRLDASNKVDVSLPAHQMTVRWIILKGQGQTRLLDYYAVVTQGSEARNNQSQSGVSIDAGAVPSAEPIGRENFTLTVGPDPASAFVLQRVVLKDFNGRVLLDASRPGS